MKVIQSILLAVCASLLFLVGTSTAQEQIAVPLSNAGEPGQLHLNLIRGSIDITGYEGDEVVIRHNSQHTEVRDREETRDGMRRLSGSSRGFEVQERNNIISISGMSLADNIEFEILVPNNFSLKLSLVNGQRLNVDGVDGNLEISNVNGGVNLTNVGGSALINTVNGDIIATFQSVAAERPMAFSNVNGDIDITLPNNAQFSAKIKSELGEVFTDFEMDVLNDSRSVTTGGVPGAFHLSINKWVHANANGGGPEYLFKTLRGDILIRSQ
ncbi:hypothetical protein BH23BAC3_BH23BAC3_22590 [soil metagenome]